MMRNTLAPEKPASLVSGIKKKGTHEVTPVSGRDIFHYGIVSFLQRRGSEVWRGQEEERGPDKKKMRGQGHKTCRRHTRIPVNVF